MSIGVSRLVGSDCMDCTTMLALVVDREELLKMSVFSLRMSRGDQSFPFEMSVTNKNAQ